MPDIAFAIPKGGARTNIIGAMNDKARNTTEALPAGAGGGQRATCGGTRSPLPSRTWRPAQ